MLLFKKSGTNRPYDSLEWKENGTLKKVSFFFDENTKKRRKGLCILCQDLGLIEKDEKAKDYSLKELREIISKHQAFDERSNLEILGEK